MWVEKKVKSLRPHFRFQSVGTVDFSMGSAAKSTSARPSTITPVQCPECGTKPWCSSFGSTMECWLTGSTRTRPRRCRQSFESSLKIREKEKSCLVKFAKKAAALEPRKESVFPMPQQHPPPPPVLLLGIFRIHDTWF